MSKRITADSIERFDFKKKPKNANVLMPFVRNCICRPALKIRKHSLKIRDMEGIEGPYLLLCNHASMVDFFLMLTATEPHMVNNVMTLEGFNTYTEFLARNMGIIGTRKFIDDFNLIKNIRYSIHKMKNVFVMFPEARYSLDGCTSHLPKSLGKLVRLLKVPVVMLKINGNFVTCPQWNKIDKNSYVEAEMFPIITAEEAESLSPAQINKKVKEAFAYDDYEWQYKNKISIKHPKRAQGLHSLLYKCPSCGTEHETDSQGTMLWCNHCKKEWEMDEYGRLHATTGETEFGHIPDWSNWERECVRKEIEEGTYYFEDEVRVETLPNSRKFYKQGMGKLIQTPYETRIECNYYGEPYTLVKTGKSLESMHIEYDYLKRGDCVDISIPDDSFWCYLSKRDAITKLSFATEEIYKLACKREKKTKE